MIPFEISNQERAVLKNLNADKGKVAALKKLFLNVCFERPLSADVQVLAAERIAIGKIIDAFHDLEVIKPEDKPAKPEENLV